MKTFAYDIECLKNLFTATFVNVDDKNESHVFYIGLGKDDYSDLLSFLKQKMTLVGYNNDSYDNPMIRFLMLYRGSNIVSSLYDLSSKLIDDNFRNDKKIMELRYPKAGIFLWKSIDLMRILAFDKLGISLKQVAINLKWHKIQDLPVKYDAVTSIAELDKILAYNLNDVLITLKLYEEIESLRKLRDELSNNYHVDLTSASKSRMANLILEHIYSETSGKDIRDVRNMRTKRDKVYLGDCIAKFVSFKSPELNEFLDRISTPYVYYYNEFSFKEKITFGNCNFVLGIGGLHSVDAPGCFISDDEYTIMDVDVASYYPNLIINNRFIPEHLDEDFLTVLKEITKERLIAKKAGDKTKAEGLKIAINSIFGKFGSEFFWLYDPKQLLSTTVSGQMGLLMLVEDFVLAGIPVISCNTDGIVCKVPVGKVDEYYKIAKEWEQKTHLELEFTKYKKYIRRDVNSYIALKENGETKEKGVFLKEIELEKAYHMPIVAKALYAYFINNVPVRETIEKSNDILDFCISQKTGNNFVSELHTILGIEELQKTNRFYISTKGGAFFKRDKYSNHLTGLYVGNTVQILNEYDEKKPFKDYNVNFLFYEKEVMKIVDEIEPKQMKLFSLDDLGQSRVMTLKVTEQNPKKESRQNNFEVLEKLGKNQLLKKIQDIVENKEIISGINHRFVYVIQVSVKEMVADIYSLGKGTRVLVGINHKEYSKNKLEAGQLVYCDKFDKTDYGYTLTKYTITDKITREGKKML